MYIKQWKKDIVKWFSEDVKLLPADFQHDISTFYAAQSKKDIAAIFLESLTFAANHG